MSYRLKSDVLTAYVARGWQGNSEILQNLVILIVSILKSFSHDKDVTDLPSDGSFSDQKRHPWMSCTQR